MIVSFATELSVITSSTPQDVIADSANDQVVTIEARQDIVSAETSKNRINRCENGQHIIELRPCQVFDSGKRFLNGSVSRRPCEVRVDRSSHASANSLEGIRVVAVTAINGIRSSDSDKEVIARLARQHVIACTTIQVIVARVAIEVVVSKSTAKRVVAVTAEQHVIAIATGESVISCKPSKSH